jgi:hypothetical protein
MAEVENRRLRGDESIGILSQAHDQNQAVARSFELGDHLGGAQIPKENVAIVPALDIRPSGPNQVRMRSTILGLPPLSCTRARTRCGLVWRPVHHATIGRMTKFFA